MKKASLLVMSALLSLGVATAYAQSGSSGTGSGSGMSSGDSASTPVTKNRTMANPKTNDSRKGGSGAAGAPHGTKNTNKSGTRPDSGNPSNPE